VQTGKPAEAVGHFEAAISAEPEFHQARDNLVRTLRLLGR
jgi:hypothetical protein